MNEDPLEQAIQPHRADDVPTPLYKKILAVVVLLGIGAAVYFWHGRLSADFYPPDRSFVGPNLVASIIQWVVVLIAAALIWPPTRKRLHRFMDKKLEPVHEHLKLIREHHEHANQARDDLHKKLDHIILHSPDIPNEVGVPIKPKRVRKAVKSPGPLRPTSKPPRAQ